MPILRQETKTIELPSSKAKIEVYTKFNYGMILEIKDKDIPDDNIAKLELAIILIKSWDFVDDKKVKLPINKDNIKKLDSGDGLYLINEITKLLSEKKN